jgi:hypothetical protein
MSGKELPMSLSQTGEAIKAMSKLGELIEQYPQHVLDIKMLPLSKADMKSALKMAWKVVKERRLRDAIGCGYTSLAYFQEDVGDKPINLSPFGIEDMLKNPDQAIELAKRLDFKAWDRWSGTIQKESTTLLSEWSTFEKAEG